MEPRSQRWLKASKRILPRWGQWDEAQFVDDQQAEAGKLPLMAEKPSLVPGLHQLVHQGGGSKSDGQALGDPPYRRNVRLGFHVHYSSSQPSFPSRACSPPEVWAVTFFPGSMRLPCPGQ